MTDLNLALEVCIGLAAIFTLFSLLCTTVNEALASVLRLRSANLSQELNGIIGDKAFADEFWKNPLLRSLERPHLLQSVGVKPERITSHTFVTALFDTLTTKENPDQPLLDKISDNSILKKVIQELKSDVTEGSQELRTRMALWFDEVMAQVSESYARRMRLLSFLVALALAVAANIDAVGLTKSLAQDEDIRAALVAQSDLFDEGNIVDVAALYERLDNLPPALPIGWCRNDQEDCYVEVGFVKLLGWLITALTATLGAPFWFDLIRRAKRVREFVPPVHTRPYEKSP